MRSIRTDSYWPSSWQLVIEPSRPQYLYHDGNYYCDLAIYSQSTGLSPAQALARISNSSYHNRWQYFLVKSGPIETDLSAMDLMTMLADMHTKIIMVDGKGPTKGYWLPNETGGWEFIYQDQESLLSAMFRKYVLLQLSNTLPCSDLELSLVGFWPIAQE